MGGRETQILTFHMKILYRSATADLETGLC